SPSSLPSSFLFTDPHTTAIYTLSLHDALPISFSKLLVSPERGVRKAAFHQYYQQFTGHENTLGATLTGSIHKDTYYAKVRGFKSDRKSTRLNSSHDQISYAVFCLKKKKKKKIK